MKTLFIGDIHLKITRFDLALKFLEWLDKVIVEVRPDMIINLGDSFNSHAILRSEILSVFRKHIDYAVGELNIPYYYILGNHDAFKPNDSRYHALQCMKDLYDDFIIVDKRLDIDDLNITMLPYYHDGKDFPRQTNNICIAHQTFLGADFGYKKAVEGVEADEMSAEIIISGHIHLKQSFGKVVYPGSPYSQTVHDINQVKGLTLFNTEDYATSFISCPLPMWRMLKYEINKDYSVELMHDDLKNNLNLHDHWVLDVQGPKAEIITYLGSKAYKKIKTNCDLKVRTKFTDQIKNDVIIKATSIENILTEYIDKLYDGSLDKNLIKSKALDILHKVQLSPGK